MEHLFAIKFAWLIPLLPLLGAAVSGFFGARWLKGNSHWPIWIGVPLKYVIVPKARKQSMMPSPKPKSPTRLTRNAFFAASRALGRS